MTSSFGSINPLLLTIVLAVLAVGLPIVFVLSIRFLLDRNINVGRSKELEKLIWQLHRIASALEHQLNLSFPAVQPGTEEPRDLAYLQPVAAPGSAAQPTATAPAANQARAQASPSQPSATQAPSGPQPTPPAQQPPADTPRHAGVNSMFGLEP